MYVGQKHEECVTSCHFWNIKVRGSNISTTFFFSLWGPFHVVLFNTIVFLLGMAHLKAVCSDPGVVPLPQNRVDFSDIHSGSV
jgi:hypothetical protein